MYFCRNRREPAYGIFGKTKKTANEIGSTERRGKNMEKKYMAKLVLGDMSKDGHGISEDMRFASNYPPERIAEAYEKSCKETGIQFHFVGIEKAKK